jgi:cytochrome c nitrite reductase small subunit
MLETASRVFPACFRAANPFCPGSRSCRIRRGVAGAGAGARGGDEVAMSWLRIDILGMALAVLVGVLVGVGSFTFHYGEGFSYFSTDPTACINCHIMQPQYDSWINSSHHHARCVDCHLPQDNLVSNLIAKSDNGWRHSWAFTFQDFHEPIQIIPRNAQILQDNCLRCHQDIVHDMLTVTGRGEQVSCVRCHQAVGHAAR